MVKKFNLKTGKLGEEIAKKYLQKKGYKILEQNYRTKYGEIDLVVEKDNELVIVEVRTKIGEGFGTPEDSLTKKKLRKIGLNTLSYVSRKRWSREYRTDAICIVLKPDLSIERLNHHEYII